MNKKLNIVNMDDREPKKPMKPRTLDTLTTNAISAAPRGKTDKRPKMNPGEIITTGNVEKFQRKNRAVKNMSKARAAKRKKK